MSSFSINKYILDLKKIAIIKIINIHNLKVFLLIFSLGVS